MQKKTQNKISRNNKKNELLIKEITESMNSPIKKKNREYEFIQNRMEENLQPTENFGIKAGCSCQFKSQFNESFIIFHKICVAIAIYNQCLGTVNFFNNISRSVICDL